MLTRFAVLVNELIRKRVFPKYCGQTRDNTLTTDGILVRKYTQIIKSKKKELFSFTTLLLASVMLI